MAFESPRNYKARVSTLNPPHDDIVVIELGPALNTLTKAELQDELRDQDLPTSGTKSELMERLGG